MKSTYTSNWLGRNLDNYKSIHAEMAKEKGIYEQLMACPTYTAAKRLLYGKKDKHYTCCTAGCGSSNCQKKDMTKGPKWR